MSVLSGCHWVVLCARLGDWVYAAGRSRKRRRQIDTGLEDGKTRPASPFLIDERQIKGMKGVISKRRYSSRITDRRAGGETVRQEAKGQKKGRKRVLARLLLTTLQ